MYKPPNYLRTYRRMSPLTQKDVAVLLYSINTSNVCSVEKGKNPTRIELLLVYHLLFETSVESFFVLQLENIEDQLIQNIRALVADLKLKPENTKMNQ